MFLSSRFSNIGLILTRSLFQTSIEVVQTYLCCEAKLVGCHGQVEEAPLGSHGHADAGGHALPQWPCGHLHPAGLSELRVPGAAGTQPEEGILSIQRTDFGTGIIYIYS